MVSGTLPACVGLQSNLYCGLLPVSQMTRLSFKELHNVPKFNTLEWLSWCLNFGVGTV